MAKGITNWTATPSLFRRTHGSDSSPSVFDFYASPSAGELARAQGVARIRKVGQIRGFSDPDPKEAEWLVRQVRRWRHEGQARKADR